MKREGEGTIDAAVLEEYVHQVQDGDAEAFIPIAREYQRQLYIYCCRLLGSEQDAEDAVQEIFLKAYQSISGYKATVSFNAWLYKIAYHHCLNLLHRRQLSEKLGRLLKGQIFAESAEQEFLRGAFSEPLSRALVSLPAEERSLLVLYVFHDKTYAELSEIIGKTPEAVRKKLTRIRRKVKETMMKWQGEEQWEPSLIQSKS
ncbi:RNA polymerase, sigma-24 subunit, ECF subfamily protein [Paenibacillus vortex V453]|jgi:RNA polymerase sigma factor (sigma-70 family)|uniref:RNA polymerase, sigma-24 subunit, ECF subfamily protein n=1 Tax=Paenibacillus vortex V453 TaxID=715225 RepID=A0A2R9SUW4_9BACL|nr:MULTISPECIES: RNA polymerase sigma factor [Paenibacillus]ANA82436.1 RNA polymerase subunit sigma [Paenibacillus glucanolyticus]EFU41123.1 RNA polymerase, sigma-24 subunit, ECF subfamily protein [Paenibacillus vortex V453]ETT33861.1 ECF subfamily RNA polymerase sigma-24 factor [Paenibacillus sp. FSL R5-808]MDH6672170.1 RNA polymerase sigma factor (sigma-70 family) [Paenibacillus sp. LBL]OMF80175.1 RNA polymerase subunit sigma [Paenibacillus glucanolyticus]